MQRQVNHEEFGRRALSEVEREASDMRVRTGWLRLAARHARAARLCNWRGWAPQPFRRPHRERRGGRAFLS